MTSIPEPGPAVPTGGPLVGIVMGSDSDWPVLRPAAEALSDFGVAHGCTSSRPTARRASCSTMPRRPPGAACG